MENLQEQGRQLPIERREIRGITAETILKYGGLIIAIVIAWGVIKGRLDAMETRLIEQERGAVLRQQQLDVLKTNQNTNEVWKARIEEKINIKKAEQ